jgi:hypothetical protein
MEDALVKVVWIEGVSMEIYWTGVGREEIFVPGRGQLQP